MARKAKKSTEKETTPKTQPVAVETVETTPTVTEAQDAPATTENKEASDKKYLLVVFKRTANRYYVYFKGVPPKDNVGCGCKTPESALRYMQLLKRRHGAVISQKCYEELTALTKQKGA